MEYTDETEVHLILTPGAQLCRKGDVGRSIYIVEEGLLKAEQYTESGKVVLLELYSAGDVIGCELFQNDITVYQNDISVLVSARLKAVPSDAAHQQNDKVLVSQICHQLWRSHRARVEHQYPVPVRVCRLMVELGLRFGHVRGEQISLALPLSHESYAAMVGTSRVSLTQVMNQLDKRGALSRSGKTYTFNPSKLKQIASGYL